MIYTIRTTDTPIIRQQTYTRLMHTHNTPTHTHIYIYIWIVLSFLYGSVPEAMKAWMIM